MLTVEDDAILPLSRNFSAKPLFYKKPYWSIGPNHRTGSASHSEYVTHILFFANRSQSPVSSDVGCGCDEESNALISIVSTLEGRRPTVGRLPVEILVRIFRIASQIDIPVDAPGCDFSSPGWYVVCWVCSHWRTVAISDAVLWANSYSHHHRMAPTALKRAGNAPLHYILTANMSRVPLQLNMHSGTFLEDADKFALTTPLERCHTIEVRQARGDAIQHICRLASLSSTKPLPFLERLTLEAYAWMWGGTSARLLTEDSDLFTIYGKKIRVAQFTNCYAPVNSPLLDVYSLSFLSRYQPRPRMQVLYRHMLPMSGSGLTRLELINAMRLDAAGDAFSHQEDPLRFPRLERLRIRGSADHISALLRLIDWPGKGTQVRVKVSAADRNTQSLSGVTDILRSLFPHGNTWSVLHVAYPGPKTMSTLTTVEGWDHGDPFDKDYPDTRVEFEDCGESCRWWQITLEALRAFGMDKVETLSLSVRACEYKKVDVPWAELLGHLPRLHQLRPRDKILRAIGPVQDEHVLGRAFRDRLRSQDQRSGCGGL